MNASDSLLCVAQWAISVQAKVICHTICLVNFGSFAGHFGFLSDIFFEKMYDNISDVSLTKCYKHRIYSHWTPCLVSPGIFIKSFLKFTIFVKHCWCHWWCLGDYRLTTSAKARWSFLPFFLPPLGASVPSRVNIGQVTSFVLDGWKNQAQTFTSDIQTHYLVRSIQRRKVCYEYLQVRDTKKTPWVHSDLFIFWCLVF